ncbi:MAG: VapC toxin family PIN domain ribonuclease [Desulfobulbaceae bacterium A2]|nr:MAG: VapC toxin family PIN domain ribonuclease [Desulfobulbaceae bacterium A2]
MNIVDSSGWLEYFAEGPNAGHFAVPLREPSSLVVPVITIYEVFKVAFREAGENEALQAVAAMQQGQVIDVTMSLAMHAARLSHRHNLPMADSMILATAVSRECVIWTQDAHFENLPGVHYFPKGAAGQRRG